MTTSVSIRLLPGLGDDMVSPLPPRRLRRRGCLFSLPPLVCHGPRAPALRSPRPRWLLGRGGNTLWVLSGPVSRRPPHGEHPALSGRVGVGTPRRPAPAVPLRLWVPRRPGPGAALRRATLPPACSGSLVCWPDHPLAGSLAASTTSGRLQLSRPLYPSLALGAVTSPL